MTELRAAVVRAEITPEVGTYLAGYARLRGSKGVRDPLLATALMLDDGATRVALVSLDLLAIHEDVVGEIEAGLVARAGLSPEGLVVACSHSHYAPMASAQDSGKEARFVAGLVEALVHAGAQAADALEPVTLHAGSAEVGIAVNRRQLNAAGEATLGRNPEGAVDRSLHVVEARRPGGEPLATIVNMACHPTEMHPKYRRVSAAWPGEMRARVERETGAPVLFVQGATGDLNPDHDWGDEDLCASAKLGGAAGEATLAARAKTRPVAGVPLAAAREQVWLAILSERGRRGVPIGHRGGLSRHTKVPRALVDPVLDRMYPWKTKARRREDGGWEVPLVVSGLRLGEVALCGHGAETFNAIGTAIKSGSPASHTLFAGYANGMIGYLPTAEAFGQGGYEVDTAPYFYRLPGRLRPDSEARATDGSLEMLRVLWRDRPPSG